jgi:hypothetical protein
MSEHVCSQHYEAIETRQEYTMVTGTSGISGLTGGNCSIEEHNEYQRLYAQWDASRATTCPTLGDALAADLTAPFNRFCAVFMAEGKRLGDQAYAQMEAGLAELGSTILALTRKKGPLTMDTNHPDKNPDDSANHPEWCGCPECDPDSYRDDAPHYDAPPDFPTIPEISVYFDQGI